MTKRSSKAAGEFAAQLANDAEYQTRRREIDTRAAELALVCAADEASLVRELRAFTPAIASVWDYVATAGAPAAAAPTLVAHLALPHHARTREGIVRSLSTEHARPAAFETLCRLFQSDADRDWRWVVANAIASMAAFQEVAALDGIAEFRELFGPTREAPSSPSAT